MSQDNERTPLVIHRPVHLRRGVRVCEACRVVWPCLVAKAEAARAARRMSQGDTIVHSWWFIPKREGKT
jgi:hypothetical protein